MRLHTYSGEPLEVVRELELQVQCQNQVAKLPLMVVRNEGPMQYWEELDGSISVAVAGNITEGIDTSSP